MGRGAKLRNVLFLCLAVLLHVGLLSLNLLPKPLPKKDLGELWVEPMPKKLRQIVETLPSEEDNDEKAEFAGEFRNRVKKQMRASRTGRFFNSPSGPAPEPGEGNLDSLLPEVSSTSPDELPDEIAEGGLTLLNTDPVRYASFLNRVKEEIYGPWVSHMNSFIEYRELTKNKLSENTYVTRLKVILDTEGHVVAIRTLKSSGIPEIDQATKQAFWDREPFRNPPFLEEGELEDSILPVIFQFNFEYKTAFFGIQPFRL